MTLEEGLVALLAVAAAILLYLGLAQALDARPRRAGQRARRRLSATPSGAERPAVPAGPPAPEVPQLEQSTGPARRSWRRPDSGARAESATPTPVPAAAQTGQPDLPLLPEIKSPEIKPAEAAAAPPPEADPALDAIERALALQQEGQHAHVIEAAVAHLDDGGAAEATAPSFVRAALWTLVGVSRHALGDIEGAQGALEAAVRTAPDGVSEGCPERIAAAATPAARQLLAAADAMSPSSSERLAVLRMAVLWLEWCIVAAQAAEEVSVLLERAREALWDGYVVVVRSLIRRRRFAQAHELVRQALDSGDLPAAHRAPLAKLSAQSVVREIGRLVATARGTETPKADALDALKRAQEILDASPVDAVTPGRWHAANRRVWKGYTLLAHRDIEGFDLEAALEPLFSALHLRDLDPGLERRTRGLLVRTIERIADGAGETIGRLLEKGDRDTALQRWRDVRGIVQKSRDEGLSHEELANAFGRARQLLEQIEATRG